jgi:dienelactone hydrolase
VHTEDIRYQADGASMVGHLAFDDQRAGQRPAVLVSHEGSGLDQHARGIAEKLAALGYIAFALDYFGDGKRPPPEQLRKRMGVLAGDPGLIARIAQAGLDVLLGQPAADADRAAAIGYCFGGIVSLELARTGADLKAVVGFHPGFTPPRPADSAKIRGSVLMCCGTEDPFATPEDRLAFEAEMREARVAGWRLELYGGVKHSFTNPAADEFGMPGFGYDADADRRSWSAMLDLFGRVLGPP